MITTVEHARQVLLQNLKPEARVTDGTQTAEPGIWSFSVTMFSHDRGKDDTYIFYVSSRGQVWCAKGSVEIWKKEALLKEALIEGCEVVYHSSLDGGNELFEVTYAGNTFYIVMDNEYMFRLFYGGTDSMLQPLLRTTEPEPGKRRPRRRQR